MQTTLSEQSTMIDLLVTASEKAVNDSEMRQDDIDDRKALYRAEERAKERTRRDRETRLDAIDAVNSMREKAEMCGLFNMTMDEIDAEIALCRAAAGK